MGTMIYSRLQAPRNKRPLSIGSESVPTPNFEHAGTLSSKPQITVSKIAGLKEFYYIWSYLTSDVFILSCIKVIGFVLSRLRYNLVSRDVKMNNRNDPFIQQAIENLLSLGAIKECNPCEDQFLSSYFLVKKANGGWRFVLNLKQLNSFMQVGHFKLEDMRIRRYQKKISY